MQNLPVELLRLVCDFAPAADVMRVHATCTRNMLPLAYIQHRNRERAFCFTSPSTHIITEWKGGSTYRSRIVVGTPPTTITCHSRRGRSCRKVCERMVGIVIPYAPGYYRYLDSFHS